MRTAASISLTGRIADINIAETTQMMRRRQHRQDVALGLIAGFVATLALWGAFVL